MIMERKVKITIDRVHVRRGPNKEEQITSDVHKNDIFTIVDEKNGFGQLKSKSGWIELKWCEKIS